MKFFKKIGRAVKKNVSLKNLVKGVAKFGSFIPVIGSGLSAVTGSLSDAHEAKKAEREALRQAEAINAQAMAEMSNTEKKELVNHAVITSRTQNVPIKDVIVGAIGGALTGAGGAIAGDTTVVTATSNLADNTIMATLKKNGLKYFGILLAGILFLVAVTKFVFNSKSKPKRKW